MMMRTMTRAMMMRTMTMTIMMMMMMTASFFIAKISVMPGALPGLTH